MRVSAYCIVSEVDVADFEGAVMSRINTGWEPYGTPFSFQRFEGEASLLTQVMIKRSRGRTVEC